MLGGGDFLMPIELRLGYSRVDKVNEHLWKKHGDLGYTRTICDRVLRISPE